MTYTYKSCPHCGKMYENYNTATKTMTVTEGCPIVTCKYCNKKFIDNDIKEQAFNVDGPTKINVFSITISPIFWLGLPFAISLSLAIKEDSVFSLLMAFLIFFVYIWFIYKTIKNKNEINQEILQEYQKSCERCSNKEYIIFLIDSGYKVPTLFLEKYFPDLIEYKNSKKEINFQR